MKTKIPALLLIALATLACGSSRSSQSANSSSGTSPSYPGVKSDSPVAEKPMAAANSSGGSGGGGRGSGNGNGSGPTDSRTQTQMAADKLPLDQTQTSQNAPTTQDRKIVRNADVQLESQSPEQTQQKITAIADSMGGFVVESEQSSSDVKVATRDIATMTVRVPAAKFTETIEAIRKNGDRVIKETIKGEDVTEEFIDIEARLKAKKALEAQFMEIMKRANSVSDALDVQSQLAGVRGEIERIEGRKRFLENQASLSTIKVRIQTPAAFASSSQGFGYRLAESLGTGFDIAMGIVLGLVTIVVALLPFIILIGVPLFLIIWRMRSRQKRPVSVTEIAKEELGDK